MGSTQEMTVDYAAGSAEQAYAGLRINLVPREGGNAFKGSFVRHRRELRVPGRTTTRRS